LAIFENEYTISFRDLGNSNCITNKAFLSFMENIGGMHSDSVGLGINDIEKTNLSWVLLGWKVKIIKRALYGEVIHAKTWARHTNKFFTHRDFEFYDSKGELIAIATSKWVLIDINKQHLCKITDDILEMYKPETKTVFENSDIDKLEEPSTFSDIYTYIVQRSNIDINNHMHNLDYLDVAYEFLPEKVYYNCDLKNVEIMYKKEIKLGDNIKCLYSFENGFHYITMKSEDEKILHAIVKLY